MRNSVKRPLDRPGKPGPLLPRLSPERIGLIGHMVAGYPNERDAFEMVRIMAGSGVALIEIQIPFSEPMADGSLLMRANHKALENGSTVAKAFAFAEKVAGRFDVPFVFMTYFNPIFRMGCEVFARRAIDAGVRGLIVPDMPLDRDEGMEEASWAQGLAIVPVVPPNISDERLLMCMERGSGFVYAVARAGVTGGKTKFGSEQTDFLRRIRNQSGELPIAMGFGLTRRADLKALKGTADYGIIGSHGLRVWEEGGRRAYQAVWAGV